MGEISKITDKETLLIFTYSPAGLGHLRVTEALFNGIPKNTYPILLGSQDKRITYIHRVMSVHDITRRLFEWLQIGRAEEITTPMYRFYLRTHTGMLTRQINTIIDQSFTNPQTILIVATHFGLAHQAAQLKEQLKKNRRLNVKIMVQVTDDSPQHIWYVPGADLTLVPSNRTRDQLIAYGKSANLAETNIQINPYPLSPHLNGVLPLNDQLSRFNQLDAKANAPIHLVFPISGAAVGMQFTRKLIDSLYQKSHRFMAHVVSRNAPFTQKFLYDMNNRPYVSVQTSGSDKQVISLYEELYSQHSVAIEITKPSEQAFKALISPDKRGGSILFFSNPVGRQEYDNLNFLRRHKLIPLKTDQKRLWNFAKKDELLNQEVISELKNKAGRWRGLLLPNGSHAAANFIWWCIRKGILQSMYTCRNIHIAADGPEFELRPDGVELFWQKASELLE